MRGRLSLPSVQSPPRATSVTQATLAGLGTATPDLDLAQDALISTLADAWGLKGAERNRWERIVAGSGVVSRHGVVPVEAVMAMGTAERMATYARHAPALAATAARSALRSADVEPSMITDLIVVTCTGFSAPGVDVDLVERLDLSRNVRRSVIGFMGCFGALVGLRAAIGAAAAAPGGASLVVCVELCSLHLRNAPDPQNLVASALFGDGAAAAVVRHEDSGGSPDAIRRQGDVGQVTLGRSVLLPTHRDSMSWRITDHGFAMTLDSDLPEILLARSADWLAGVSPTGRTWIVHPGGPAILRAVEQALGESAEAGIASAWRVLRDHGNMSSAAVLFVLADALASGARPPAELLAFGPGLAVERVGIRLRP